MFCGSTALLPSYRLGIQYAERSSAGAQVVAALPRRDWAVEKASVLLLPKKLCMWDAAGQVRQDDGVVLLGVAVVAGGVELRNPDHVGRHGRGRHRPELCHLGVPLGLVDRHPSRGRTAAFADEGEPVDVDEVAGCRAAENGEDGLRTGGVGGDVGGPGRPGLPAAGGGGLHDGEERSGRAGGAQLDRARTDRGGDPRRYGQPRAGAEVDVVEAHPVAVGEERRVLPSSRVRGPFQGDP